MTSKIEDRAKYLASQPYAVEVMKDKTTTGEDVFLAKNPQLYGCMAQGATIEEAIANLADARLDYIEDLLEDGDPVPDVDSPSIYTSSEAETVLLIDETVGVVSEREFLSDLDKVIQPRTREFILKIEPIMV
jgi:predicted RNase H-like HicB family nuclease